MNFIAAIRRYSLLFAAICRYFAAICRYVAAIRHYFTAISPLCRRYFATICRYLPLLFTKRGSPKGISNSGLSWGLHKSITIYKKHATVLVTMGKVPIWKLPPMARVAPDG